MSKKKKKNKQAAAVSHVREKTQKKSPPLSYVKKIDPWLIAIFAAAALARLIFVWNSSHVAFFDAPLIDAEMYDRNAMAMLTTGVTEKNLYQAPFYSVFLSAVYFLFGHNYVVPRIIQSLMGAASCVMVASMGNRFFGRRAGVVSGFITAFYGPLIFFETDLLRHAMIVFLALAMLSSLLLWRDTQKTIHAALSGLMMGLSIITSENIFVFMPVALAWMWFRGENKKWLAPAIFICVSILPIVPVTIRNYISSGGRPSLISSQGGVNFYIGNGRESEHLTALQPGIEWDELLKAPVRALGESATSQEQSRWFVKKTIDDIKKAPVIWIRKMVKKFYLVFYGEELTPNNDIGLYQKYSWLMRILIFRAGPVWIPFGLIAPLFFVCIFMKRPAGDMWLPLGFIAVYAVALAMFHVRSRYRLPIAPVMIPFAAAGALWLWESARVREKKLLIGGAVFILTAVLFNAELADVSYAHQFPTDYYLGKAWFKKHEYGKALIEYEKFLKDHPDNAEFQYDYGQALLSVGRDDEAISRMERARDLSPGSALIRYNLAEAYTKKSEKLRDKARYQLNAPVPAEHAEGERNYKTYKHFLGLSISEFEAAGKDDPSDLTIKYKLAFLYKENGDEKKFKNKIEEYIKKAKNVPDEKEWVERAREALNGKPATGYSQQGANNPAPTRAGLKQNQGIQTDPSGIPIALPQEERDAPNQRQLPSNIRNNTSPDAMRKLQSASQIMDGGDYFRAAEEVKKVINDEPGSDLAWFLLGDMYERAGKTKEAEDAYRKSIELNPANAMSHNNIGNIYRDSGRYAEAERHYNAALTVDPSNVAVKRNIEKMKMLRGK